MALRKPNRYFLVIGLGIFFGLAILAAIWLAVPTSAQRGVGTIQPPATPRVAQTFPRPNIPELSDAERAQALAIALSDPRLGRILANRKYTITAVGVWHTKGLEKIGAGMTITLAEPTSLEDDWPYYVDDLTEKSSPPYQEKVWHHAFKSTNMLIVSVDLKRNKLVGLVPAEIGEVRPP